MTEAVTQNEIPLTPVESGSVSSDEALGAIYDRLTTKGIESEPEAEPSEAQAGRDERGRFVKQAPAEASPQDGEADVEEAPASVSERQAAPVSLPATWRQDMADIWEAVPEQHRDRLAQWSVETNNKLRDMGRKLEGYSDVQSVFDDMLQTYPDRFNGPEAMKPADGIKFLYQVQKDMDQKPVETLVDIATRYNIIPDLAKALGVTGDQVGVVQTLQNTIQQLEARLANKFSPDMIRQEVTRTLSQREMEAEVTKFAAEKPFFEELTPDLPDFIAIARKKMPEASHLELLSSAYDMAVNANPELRQKVSATQRVSATSEQRVAAAKKATSINIKSTAASKGKPRSDEEAMGDVYDRLRAS